MPCIELRIDNSYYRIDSPDQDLCGSWIAVLLRTFPITPATCLQLRVTPFYVPDPHNPYGAPGVPDWETDWVRWHSPEAASPADAARQLAARIAAVADQLDPPAEITSETQEG